MKKRIFRVLAVLMAVLLLAGCSGAGNVNTGSVETKDTGYSVLVVNVNNTPVEGVTVQFCTDTECMLGETGADGVAEFDTAGKTGNFTVHILAVPEGYDEDETEYVTRDTYSRLKITLTGGAVKVEEPGVEILETIGMTISLPEFMQDLKGCIIWNDSAYDAGSYYCLANYYGFSKADYDALMEAKGNVDNDDENSVNAYKERLAKAQENINGPVCFIFATKNGEDIAFAHDIKIGKYTLGDVVGADYDLGKTGDYQYYLYTLDYSKLSAYLGETTSTAEIVDEYVSLVDDFDADAFKDAVALNGPVATLGVGDIIYFEALDLDGNMVTSKELFAGHDVTMVNCWATWCTYCIGEFPELVDFNKKMAKKGNRIVGICEDGLTKNEKAKQQIKDAGIEYPNVYIDGDFDSVFALQGFPTTYFVDSEGRILTEPIAGADVAAYKKAYKEALKAVGK